MTVTVVCFLKRFKYLSTPKSKFMSPNLCVEKNKGEQGGTLKVGKVEVEGHPSEGGVGLGVEWEMRVKRKSKLLMSPMKEPKSFYTELTLYLHY